MADIVGASAVALLARTLRTAGRRRISLDYLAACCGLTTRALSKLLADRSVRDFMRKHGWYFTDSKALGLPSLERQPYTVPFLVRD
jgi:hypothetical protein